MLRAAALPAPREVVSWAERLVSGCRDPISVVLPLTAAEREFKAMRALMHQPNHHEMRGARRAQAPSRFREFLDRDGMDVGEKAHREGQVTAPVGACLARVPRSRPTGLRSFRRGRCGSAHLAPRPRVS